MASKLHTVAGCVLLASLASCSTPSTPSTPSTVSAASKRQAAPTVQPTEGFAAREPGTDATMGSWWLTSHDGSITVMGPPDTVVSVGMTLVPTPCGSATVSLGGQTSTVTAPTPVVATVLLDASGAGHLAIQATSGSCRPKGDPRTLYALVSNPAGAFIGKAADPLLEPVSGFDHREINKGGEYGWWMTSPKGNLEVSGPADAKVAITVTLVAPPCSPAKITFDSSTRTVEQRQAVALKLTLDNKGKAQLPIAALNQPCHPKGDPRSLYAMVFAPSVKLDK